MKIRFQADNDFNGRIIRAVLRLNPAINFQTAPEIGLHLGTPDDKVLRLAAQDNRVLVSGDFKTMPYHFADFIEQQSSPGVILVSQKLSIGEAANALHLIWEASEAEEYLDRIYRVS